MSKFNPIVPAQIVQPNFAQVWSGSPVGAAGAGSPIYVMFYREPGAYDILYDFFGKDFHGLMSSSGNVFEFRERFGMIWIQMQASEDYYSKAKPWKPIDKQQFFNFIQDPTQNALHSTAILPPETVLKMMSDPNNK